MASVAVLVVAAEVRSVILDNGSSCGWEERAAGLPERNVVAWWRAVRCGGAVRCGDSSTLIPFYVQCTAQ